jgi:hypothetical protein
MNHWDWLAIFAFGTVGGLLWGVTKLLERVNDQLGKIRYLLERMDERDLNR